MPKHAPAALLFGVVALGSGLGACGPQTFQSASAIPIVGGDELVSVTGDRIIIHEKIQFAFDDATILEESHALLDRVAAQINKHDEIKKLRVEGHTCKEGAPAHNMKLSKLRAEAVVDYLVEQGDVPRNKLLAKGWGDTKPLVDEDTDEAKEKNRRVEFYITAAK